MRVKGSTRIKMSLLPGSEKVQVIVSEDETSPIQIFHQRREGNLVVQICFQNLLHRPSISVIYSQYLNNFSRIVFSHFYKHNTSKF